MKFQLSGPPAVLPHSRTKLWARRSGGLQAAVRAKGSNQEDFGLEAKATLANEVSDPVGPPAVLAPFEKETLATHRPALPDPAFEIRLFDILRLSIFCGFFLLSLRRSCA